MLIGFWSFASVPGPILIFWNAVFAAVSESTPKAVSTPERKLPFPTEKKFDGFESSSRKNSSSIVAAPSMPTCRGRSRKAPRSSLMRSCRVSVIRMPRVSAWFLKVCSLSFPLFSSPSCATFSQRPAPRRRTRETSRKSLTLPTRQRSIATIGTAS